MSLEKYSEMSTSKIHDTDNHIEDRSVKQECICKEELDLDWQEEDELSGQGSNNSLLEEYVDVDSLKIVTDIFCSKIEESSNKEKLEPKNALFNALVVIERLPEQLIKMSIRNKENIYPKIKSTGLAKNNLNKLYEIFYEHCKKVVKPDSKSTSCSKCKRAVIYKCRKCSKSFKSESGISYHLKAICRSEGNIYQCPGCPYKSVFQSSVIKHVQLLHKNLPTSDIEVIASSDLQKDLGNSELYLHKCLKCGKQFKHVQYLNKHFKACGNLECQAALIGKDDIENGTATSSNSEDHFQQQAPSHFRLSTLQSSSQHSHKHRKFPSQPQPPYTQASSLSISEKYSPSKFQSSTHTSLAI